MIAEFFLTVLYSQITVAVPGPSTQALLWTDDHVAQGFAWSPDFVGFGVPDHDGRIRVMVQRSAAFEASAATLWAVQTPLRVHASPLAIGTIEDERAVPIPAGSYNLVFEAQSSDGTDDDDVAYVVHLHFVATTTPSFAILKRGDVLETDRVLLISADPA